MTVDENLRLGLTGRRAPDGVAEDRAWVADLFPAVRDFGARRAGDLSGGQQQQVAIARALIARPDVLLLDEPSLGLAPKTVESVFEALTEVRKRGVTVLLVEQRAQLAVGFCDRTYVMAAGEIRLTLGPKDANDTGRIIAAYFS
jgi:branched-chain amino acid transport system ATP-binding protein